MVLGNFVPRLASLLGRPDKFRGTFGESWNPDITASSRWLVGSGLHGRDAAFALSVVLYRH